jgi:peptide/nickel transport system permease protein
VSVALAAGARSTRRLRVIREHGGARLVGGVVLATLMIGGMLLLTQFGDLEPSRTDPTNRLLGLGAEGHPLGTDQVGRDLFDRVVAGFRWSLGVGLVATLITFLIGTTIGIVAASSEGAARTVLTRLIDVSLSFPYLVIAVAIMAVVGRGFWPLSITLGVVSWAVFARMVYAEGLSLMHRDYVLAARLAGTGRGRTLLTHLLPALRPTIMVVGAFTFADLLIAESGLSFLGIGAPLTSPSLGNMLAEGRQYLVNAPRMTFVPATVIVLTVVAANLIGDGVAARARARSRRIGDDT